MNKLPIDDKDGLVITVSVMRKGTGHDVSHYLMDGYLSNERQLTNILTKASKILWESHDISKV